ncbi:MAG: alpha/beta fold hydrolase [Pseudomonadota bacterium]
MLANSLAATHEMWEAQCAALRGRWRLVRFNYAGHGDPGFAGDAPASIEGIAQALLSQLDTVGIQRFSFVGLSLGGMLGLHVAGSVPERIDRLVVANCRYYQTEELRQQWDQRIAAVQGGGLEAIAGLTVERWLTPAFRQARPDAAAAIHRMICSTSRGGYAAAAAAVRDYDARPLLGRIACPVLVISGVQDAAAPADHLAELAQSLNARHLALDPCAHLSCVERSEAFSEGAGAFLS